MTKTHQRWDSSGFWRTRLFQFKTWVKPVNQSVLWSRRQMVAAGYREAVIMTESPLPSSWRCRPSNDAHAVVLLDAGTIVVK